jgi:hypothetical protein
MARVHMAGQLGMNASRMDNRSAYATLPMPPVKLDSKENVGCLRPAVSDEGLIGCLFEVGVVKIDIRKTMTRRRDEVDQAPSFAEERRDPIHYSCSHKTETVSSNSR